MSLTSSLTPFQPKATVTEERFVPALNVIASEFNIPDDVAGATLMAAGASSPELFSSIVALFITHSALGLGTIVGSEIFNQLIICAGAVWASRSGKLELDPAILIREVGFYALSIALLYFALRDVQVDEEADEERIFISFFDACVVFGGYILYVIVCANMEKILYFLGTPPSLSTEEALHTAETKEKQEDYGALEEVSPYVARKSIPVQKIPFLHTSSFGREPEGNFKRVELYRNSSGEKSSQFLHMDSTEDRSSNRGNLLSTSLRKAGERYMDGSSLRKFLYIMETTRPTDFHDLNEINVSEVSSQICPISDG